MRRALCLTAILLFATPVYAADIVVLCAGAFAPVLADLTPAFEKSGDRLIITKDTAGGLIRRVTEGAKFDVIIATEAGIALFTTKAQVTAGANVARAGIAIGVRTGSPKPDISTEAAFKQTIMAAKSVAYVDPASGGSSGIYLKALFDRMGIGPDVAKKAVLTQGGLAAEKVASGEAEIGLQQASEILIVKGVTLVGPMPAAIQSYTVYAAGISSAAANPDAARRLMALFSSAEGKATVTRLGMEAP